MSTYDAYTRVSNNQSLVTPNIVTGISVSTSSIRLIDGGTGGRISGRNPGPGEPVFFRVAVTTAFTGIDFLNVSVVFATDSLLLSAVTPVNLITIPVALLVVGAEFDVAVPAIPSALASTGAEYLGLLYNTTAAFATTTPALIIQQSANPSAGALSAFMSLGDTAGLPRRYLGNYTNGDKRSLFTFNATSDVNDGTDTITVNNHGYSNGERVVFQVASGLILTGLTAGTTYFIVGATTNTFQVATTSGGSAVAVTPAVGTNTVSSL